jgi:hypothetical protein
MIVLMRVRRRQSTRRTAVRGIGGCRRVSGQRATELDSAGVQREVLAPGQTCRVSDVACCVVYSLTHARTHAIRDLIASRVRGSKSVSIGDSGSARADEEIDDDNADDSGSKPSVTPAAAALPSSPLSPLARVSV